MKQMNNKGQMFQQMGALGVGIAGLAITLVITFLIISQGRNNIVSNGQACDNSALTFNSTAGLCCTFENCSTGAVQTANASGTSSAYNATHTLGTAVDTIPSWVPLIVNQQVYAC